MANERDKDEAERAETRDYAGHEQSRPRLAASPPKKLAHKDVHHRSAATLLLPPMQGGNRLSVEDRQSRQMRSFLQNFLSDDRGRFQDVLDLRQHALDTGITVTDATIQEVVNTVPNVKGLRLTGCSAITDAGIWAIARQCTALDTVYLAGCDRITDLGLRMLAHNCRLVTVDLSDCPQVTDSILQTLAAGCWMLQTFIIQRSRRVTDAGIVKLAQCCKGLRHLDFSECEHVGEYGDKALIEIGRYSSQLRVLDLFGCRHVHDVGVKAIAAGCPLLMTLKLTGCQGVSSAALRALAKRCHDLEILSLAGCIKTANEDLSEIARNCPRIHWLDISGSPNIGASGLAALAHFCRRLAYLNISNCPRINDAALLELAAEKTEKTSTRTILTQLAVRNCPRITERGVTLLTDACSNLLTVDMTECEQIGRRFLQKLIQKLEFVEWASDFFGFQPLPNAAELCYARDRRVLEHKSAIRIQALVRGCLARGGVWHAKLRYVERTWLPRIQARIRGFLARKQLTLEAHERKKRAAAILIAGQYRNWRLRRMLARHRRLMRIRHSEEASALIFQKIFRGHRDRKLVRSMQDGNLRQKQLQARVQAMLELAAIKVQLAYRGHQGRGDAAMLRASREAYLRQLEREREAARLLQRVYRGHQGRRQRAARLAELLHEKKRQDGAVKLQKIYRGHKGRRNALLVRVEVEQLRQLNAALTIQRHWRGLKDKHLAAVLIGLIKLRAREQEAAHVIQRAYRMYASRGFMKAMRLAQQLQRRRLQGTRTIQKLVRGHRGRAQAEVQRELRKLEVVTRPLFNRESRLELEVSGLEARVHSLQLKVQHDEEDEAMLALELDKTMQIKTKYHDSSRITGTPQRYLTQYLQVQLADQLRAKRLELAMESRALEQLMMQWNDAQKQLRAVKRELEPLTIGVVTQTKENRTRRLQTRVRRERVAATCIQRVFRGYRVRCAIREGANCWIELPVTDSERTAAGYCVYFYNAFSGESRWSKPLAMSIFQDKYLEPLLKSDPTQASSVQPGSISNWYEAFDDRVGQSYYYNSITKEYRWERPDTLSPVTTTILPDTISPRKRKQWLREQVQDGGIETLIDASQVCGQLGQWEHRTDPLSEYSFFFHLPTGEVRSSLSPRSVHATLAGGALSRRSARSVNSSSARPLLWQYRYGYEYSSDGELVRIPDDARCNRPIWTEHNDESSHGMTYYYNHISQEYRWEKPPEFGLDFETYANSSNSSRDWFQAQQQDSGSTSSSRRDLLTERSQKMRPLGRKWVECVDMDAGNTYYYNEISGESRWSLSPRSARDMTDVPGEIPLELFEQVKNLREHPVAYTARVTHIAWLENAMEQHDWSKVDVLVQQIRIREQSKAVEDSKARQQNPKQVSLSAGWAYYQDSASGHAYYYNSLTGETSWRPPSLTGAIEGESIF